MKTILVQDSCWETYRLSKWQREGSDAVQWTEDMADIRARIESLNEKELVLGVQLGSEVEQHRYAIAAVPYVCPDMKR